MSIITMTHNNNFFSSTNQTFYNRKYLSECALWRYSKNKTRFSTEQPTFDLKYNFKWYLCCWHYQ